MKSCKVIRGGESFLGKQGLNYFAGISAESANAEAICMHMLVMPPGASAKPHYHESHEVPMAPLTQNVVIAGFIPATHFSACSDTRRVVHWSPE